MLLWRITKPGRAWNLHEGVVVQAERWFDAREWGRAHLGIDEFDGDGAIEHPCPDAILRWVGTDAGARPHRHIEAELAPWVTRGPAWLTKVQRRILELVTDAERAARRSGLLVTDMHLAGVSDKVARKQLVILEQHKLLTHARLGVHRAWRLTEWGKSYARGDH